MYNLTKEHQSHAGKMSALKHNRIGNRSFGYSLLLAKANNAKRTERDWKAFSLLGIEARKRNKINRLALDRQRLGL